MIDVDHFKQVNDTCGHLVGDHVLVQIGRGLRACLRSSDLAGRYGGEEFCVLAANTDLAGGQAFGERVRQLVEQLQFTGTCAKRVYRHDAASASPRVGPATESARELLDAADRAMYMAKKLGGAIKSVWRSPPSQNTDT